jgi:hypothetical protein
MTEQDKKWLDYSKHNFRAVHRDTRATMNGKEIWCKFCGTSHVVYHFSWIAIQCQWCDMQVQKHQFSTRRWLGDSIERDNFERRKTKKA